MNKRRIILNHVFPKHSLDMLINKFVFFLLTEEKDCLLDKFHKDPEAVQAAVKACRDKNGGGTCIKAIPQLKPCFAS